MAAITLHLLGSPRFERDGRPVSLSSSKAVALLGYLAANPDPARRDRLLDLLWPASVPEAARKNLRNTLWAIRQTMGAEAITADEQQVSLGESVWSDVRELEAWVGGGAPGASEGGRPANGELDIAAVAAGPFLDGLVVDDAPDFEVWLTGERERLGQLAQHALAARVAQYQARGDWNQVLAVASRALEQDNLQEPMYRARMEAHARLGERAEALREYDTLRGVLARELSVEPLEQTESLRAAIAAGAYDQREARLSPLVTAGSRPERPPAEGPQATPFVGRKQERELLDDELAAAGHRRSRVVVIRGELGIGKSRLWQEWSASQSERATVLETRALESTQALPLAPVEELFRAPALVRCLLESPPRLAPIWLAEIARLAPEIGARALSPAAAVGLPQEEERRRLFEAIAQALLALDRRPIVLFVDDLQWADAATLDWLDYIIHRLEHEPLLLVVALRPEDAPALLARLLARWAREGRARRIELPRLTEEESAALAAALGVGPQVARRVQLQSAGNPYFLMELIRALPSENVPPALAELVRARLERLPDPARQVLQAGAVLEPDFDFSTLRRTSGRDEQELLDALDVLLDAGVLVERAEVYAFSHPLVGEVVRTSLSGARRAFLQRRAAEALQVTYAGRLPPAAGRIAAHYADAGEPLLAARFAQLAGEHSLELAAPAEAAAFYRQALAFEPSPQRHLGLGEALFRQGELVEARAEFEAALNGFRAAGDRKSAGRTGLRVAETFFPSAQFNEGNRWIEESVAEMGPEGDPEAHALAHWLLGAGQQSSGRVEQAEQNLREAAEHAQDLGSLALASRSNFLLGNLLAERGELGEALGAFTRAAEQAERAGDEFQRALSLNNLAYHHLLAGDPDAAHREVETGLALAEQRALRVPLQHLYSTRGELALAEGRWGEAQEWFERGMAEAERNRNSREVANARANLALAAAGLGDLDGALVLLEAARDASAQLDDRHLQLKIELELAGLYLRRGERAAARQALRRAKTGLKLGKRKLLEEWAQRLERQLR